ncbi:sel1-repeat-containing protein ybeq [Anaeramoeba flamelloides]|uniref:Sel1-repeat-containing protein ybeq n=1 Tax=Anaeramoeba flamelloides TaxID=1746091 RepID=A0ABQ8ZBS9_9EUKA|nr:sel1-repeat-containing protein ybeq [Anaeramoeba flamelloides]
MTAVPKVYTTQDQNKHHIIAISLGKKVSKSDLTVELKESTVSVSDKEGNLIFVGALFSSINPTKSSWDLNCTGQFSMILEKVESISWEVAIFDSFNGKMDPHSTFLLSLYYEKKGDHSKAFDLLKNSAKSNHLTALFKLGSLFQSPNTNYPLKQDLEQAIEFYKKGSILGDPFASYVLGCLYHTGDGVEANNKESIKYFEKSSKQNFAKANIYLGNIYLNGTEEIKKNDKKAYNYFKKAADQGEIDAMIQSGIMLIEGNGVKRNFELANNLFQKALKKDSTTTIPINYLQDLHKDQKEYETELKKNQPKNNNLRNGLIIGSALLVITGVATYFACIKKKNKKQEKKIN